MRLSKRHSERSAPAGPRIFRGAAKALLRAPAAWSVCIALLSLCSGCGEVPDAQFVLNQRTQSLAPEAKEPVQQALADSFGTPKDLVAWLVFPVDYNGSQAVEGMALEADASLAANQFKIQFSADLGAVAFNRQEELYCTSGKYAETTLHATDYDAATGVITLDGDENLAEPPAAGDKFVLRAGHSLRYGRQLYMTHCLHCHGVSGDGDGPTAKYLNPKPRDYRLGLFKFTSTVARGQPGDKVRRDDLSRIVKNGIPGTYMPSFLLLKDDELAAIVEYVRWLSMRGELENKIAAEFEGDYSETAVNERVASGENRETIFEGIDRRVVETTNTAAEEVAAGWSKSEEPAAQIVPKTRRVLPQDDHQSIARGRVLYLSDKAKCATCHGASGRGDGPNTKDIQQGNDVPGLFDDWKNRITPRDLTTGIYRGGRRPIDLFRRVRAGIKGTPMPAFAENVLSDEEVWDLVNYVMSIPYERQRMSDEHEHVETAQAHAGAREN